MLPALARHVVGISLESDRPKLTAGVMAALATLTRTTSLVLRNISHNEVWMMDRNERVSAAELSKLVGLRHLALPAILSDMPAGGFASLTRLTSLNLEDGGPDSLSHLACLSSLQELALASCNLAFVEQPGLGALTSLALTSCMFRPGGAGPLRQLLSLRHLRLNVLLFLSAEDRAAFYEAVRALTALTSLSMRPMVLLRDPDVSIQISILATLTNLVDLSLSSCQLPDSAFELPTILVKLEYLNLGYNQLTRIPRLPKLARLNHLYLHCQNESAGFQLRAPLCDLFSMLPALEHLDITQQDHSWSLSSMYIMAEYEAAVQEGSAREVHISWM